MCWLCDHVQWFVTKVSKGEFTGEWSLLQVTNTSKCFTLSSSQGDAGENGPKGDAGEKVQSCETWKRMCLSKSILECVSSWELWETASGKPPKLENSSMLDL